jgi:hypothetical protein
MPSILTLLRRFNPLIRIQLPPKIDWLSRCVAEKAIAFNLLRAHLLVLQEEYDDPLIGMEDESIRWAIEKLYSWLPSLLGKKQFSVAEIWAKPVVAAALFWGPDSEVLRELAIEAEALPEEGAEPEFKLEEPTSGDPFADLLAKLVLVDGTVEGAQVLLRAYSIETLSHMTKQLNELRKPEKERMDAAKQKYLDGEIKRSMEGDQVLYHQLVGLDAPKAL